MPSPSLDDLRQRLLSDTMPRWRVWLSCGALFLLGTGAVLAFWYAFATLPGMGCYEGFVYLAGFWLLAQWLVIGYLAGYRPVPAFARWGLTLTLLVANAWFGLLVFSLRPCAAG
ncbi:MAG: hypothetical protein MI794_18575 [Pseudomonadales bacterium]|nr:hypothetical protein [Pseudomonadales bacterium]